MESQDTKINANLPIPTRPGTGTEENPMNLQTNKYIISPNNGFDTKEFEARLFSLVSKDAVYTSASKHLGVIFWAMALTEEQAHQLQDPSVCGNRYPFFAPLLSIRQLLGWGDKAGGGWSWLERF